MREVAFYLDRKPRKAADRLVAEVNMVNPGPNRRRRHRPHSASFDVKISQRNSSRTAVSTWSPAPHMQNSDDDEPFEGSRIRCVQVQRNGDKLCGVWIKAKTFRKLLQKATSKLGLPRPARRFFLENGCEVFAMEELPFGTVLFASMGEDYKGAQLTPFQLACGRVEYGQAPVRRRRQKKVLKEDRLNELVGNISSRLLILRNGDSLPDGDLNEVAVDLRKDNWFLDALNQSTARLQTSAYAKQMFNWDGSLIVDSSDLRILPTNVRSLLADGYFYGPVWIGHGEEFRHNCAVDFWKKFRTRLNAALKKAKADKNKKVYEELQEFRSEIDEFINRLESNSYRDSESTPRPPSAARAFECVRLTVFENGEPPTSDKCRQITFPMSDVLRRLPQDQRKDQDIMRALYSYCGETASGKKIQRLFFQNGQELTSKKQLEDGMKVWCSSGENSIPFIQPMVAITLSQMMVYEIDKTLLDSVDVEDEIKQLGRMAVSEAVPQEHLEAVLESQKRSSWRAVNDHAFKADPDKKINLPETTEATEYEQQFQSTVSDIKSYCRRSLSLHTVGIQVPKGKKIRENFILAPELVGQDDKKLATNKADLMPYLQKWMIDENGLIRLRLLPQLCLGIVDGKDETSDVTLNGKNITVEETKRVTLLGSHSKDPLCQWTFANDGRIESKKFPGFCLTYNGNLFQGEDETPKKNWLFVTQRKDKIRELQQWALRPTQCWELRPKTPKRINPEWHARAFWWPTSEFRFSGRMISVNLAAMAPPIWRGQNVNDLAVVQKRVYILPNGCEDLSRAVPLVVDWRPHLHCEPSFDSFDVPNRDPTVRQFLSHCSGILQLSSAARRIFNSNGVEIELMENVNNDQLLYISMGEKYIDLDATREQRRIRYLKQMLTTDTAKLRSFCALHSPAVVEMVVGFEGTAEPGAQLVILPLSEPQGELSALSARSGSSSSLVTQNSTVIGEGLNKRRFYHVRFRLDDYGYLESVGTANNRLVLTVSEKEGLSRDISLELRRADDPNQQWVVDRDGLIRCKYQTRYVISVQLPDVLTNATSPFGLGVSPLVGSQVCVQQLKPVQFGRANQLFRFDRSSGRMFPFATNQTDLDVTAATGSGICTGIVNHEEIDQLGYEIDPSSITQNLKGSHRQIVRQLALCVACAKAVRGTGSQLKRISNQRNFRCAMSDKNQRQIFFAACQVNSSAASIGSSVRTLYNLDFTADSAAEDTLGHWEQQLHELTKSQQVGPDLAPSASDVSDPLVWILARSVGTGIETGPPPVLVAGRSMAELLMQCTQKLGLAFAARGMYAMDGSRFVDCHAIADWVAENEAHVVERARILAASRCPDLLRLMRKLNVLSSTTYYL